MTPGHLSVILKAHPDSVRAALRALRRQGLVSSARLWKTLALWFVTPSGALAAAELCGADYDPKLLRRVARLGAKLSRHESATADLLVSFVRWSDPPRRGLTDWQAPWLAARPFRKEEAPGSRLARHEVRPDASGACVAGGGEARFFVETDMGTEDLGRLAEKAVRYVRALRGKRREAPWAVLVACPTPRRAANVAEAVGAALEPGDEDVARFLVTARPTLAERGPFAPVWEDAQTGDRVGLEDLPLWPLERELFVEDGDFVGFPPRWSAPRDAAGRFLPRAPRDSMTSPRGGR
jgi:hypothetical protein